MQDVRNHICKKDPLSIQDRSMDFNVIKNENVIYMASEFTMQLTFAILRVKK